MKSIFFVGIMALAIWACSPVKETSKTKATLTPKSQDSTEYEVLIIDIHFDHWYLVNYSPAKDHSNDYYRSKNLVAATTWNYYFQTGKFGRVIDSQVDYRPGVEYGIEVNRKLYWYFKFVTEYYGIPLFGNQPVRTDNPSDNQ